MERSILEKLVKEGRTVKDIAKVIGKGHTATRYWLCKHGLGVKRIHRCSCGETNPAEFTPGRYTSCRKCRSKSQENQYRKYKQKAVEYKGGNCIRCGYDKCLAALDFHHLVPEEKDPNWRKMSHWTFERIKKELDKCILVCKNCHAEIHYLE